MTISELIAAREHDWKALEELLDALEKPRTHKTSPEEIAKFSSLYRSVCADLALAESYRFPNDVVKYLNALVGRAHARLYRRRRASLSDFTRFLFIDSPRWIVSDPMFWLALALFWLPFLVCLVKCQYDPDFARGVVGEDMLRSIEAMYSFPMNEEAVRRIPAVAGYAWHNGSIGFYCFCFGCIGCFPGGYILLTNAIDLGTLFGYMASSRVDAETTRNFLEFTTAHASFELTAIVLSAAAGLRIGFGAIWTEGYARIDSIRRATVKAAPTIVLAFILFCLAAAIEGMVSPCDMSWAGLGIFDSYQVKKFVRAVTAAMLIVYFFGLGGIPVFKRNLYRFKGTRLYWGRYKNAGIGGKRSL